MEREKARPRRLIDSNPLITRDDLAKVIDAPLELHHWHRTMYEKGYLQLYVQGLQKAGVVQTAAEALDYSRQVLSSNKRSSAVVLYSDLAGNGVSSAIRKTKALLHDRESDEEERAYGLYGLHGTTSHYAIRELMQGKLPDYEKWQALSHNPSGLKQSPLSGATRASDSLWNDHAFLPGQQYHNAILPGNRIDDTLLSDISRNRDRIVRSLAQNDLWQVASRTRELYDMLYPIFGEYATRLVKQKGSLARELLTPTFLNWATAVLTMRGSLGTDDAHIFFTEVPVVCGPLRGGRVDALEVSTINGRRPNDKEQQTLSQLSQERYSSVGKLITDITDTVGGDFELDIWELKFDIGDNKRKRDSAIMPDDLASGPIQGDEDQVKRYITLGTLDGYMASAAFNPASWVNKSPITYGNLVYMLHSQPREIRFPVNLSPDEQEIVFQQEIAGFHGRGKQKAIERQITAVLFGHVNELLEGKRRKLTVPDTGSVFIRERSLQTQMSGAVTQETGLQTLIDRYKVYIDRTGSLIEKVGKDAKGKDRLSIDATRLLTAISNGTVEAASFNPTSGGKIKCLMPDHTEDTPSMQVYLNTETFICFGCGAHGKLENLPPDVKVDLKRRQVTRKMGEIPEYEISEEHFTIMGDLQAVLQKSFRGSGAERYMRQERQLDPQKAYTLGAGYGKMEVIVREMLKKGWTMEQLLSFGIISKGKGGNVYADLHNRITFPLEQATGKIDNFYGRAIWDADKRARHRKLKTGIQHGLFNAKVLEGSFSEIIMVEGVMDALSLIEMGMENVVAVIGTKNTNTLAILANSGKDIALALDNDSTGEKVTIDVLEVLRDDLNVHGKIRNFTKDFMTSHPEFAAYKDFNAYWSEQRKVGK